MNQLEEHYAEYERHVSLGFVGTFNEWLDMEAFIRADADQPMERVHYPDSDFEGEGYREPYGL